MNPDLGGSGSTRGAEERAYVERAVRVLPGGASGSWRSEDMEVIARTEGAHVWTISGRRYVDHILAWGTIVVGHSDARVNDAVHDAAGRCDLTTIGPQRGEVELAEKICTVMPCAEQVAFCLSGTEATLHAVQVARAMTGRRRLLKFHGSYHGWHDMLAVGVRAAPGREDNVDARGTESPGVHAGAAADVTVVGWNDVESLREAFRAEGASLAAAFCEPYVQSYGCVSANPGFLETLRELCTRYQVPLVFDEVKTAFRHHLGGYQALCGVVPDLTAFSKALANGYSIGGVAGRRDLMDGFTAGHASGAVMDGTSNASPYVMAGALATLSILERGGIARLFELGERMREGLRRAIADAGVTACVTGIGGSWTIYMLATPPRSYAEALVQDGSKVVALGRLLRAAGVMEPLVPLADRRLCVASSEDDVDEAVAAVASVLPQLR